MGLEATVLFPTLGCLRVNVTLSDQGSGSEAKNTMKFAAWGHGIQGFLEAASNAPTCPYQTVRDVTGGETTSVIRS